MKRREFIIGCGAAAADAIVPIAGRAQETGRVYRLGFLLPASREMPAIVAMFDELRLNGFVEGKNLTVVPGGFDLRREQAAEAAVAIVKAAPDAIIGGPDLYTRAVQVVTRTIPILAMSEDMVSEGFVASLARPGGNTTGISILSPELNGKRQDILLDAVPGARHIAALSDATEPRPQQLQALKAAARTRGIALSIFDVSTPEAIVPAIDAAKMAGAEALNFLASSLFFPNSSIPITYARAVRLPAIHHWPEAAEAGGLLGYGARFPQLFRQRARQIVKVLRGAKPADIPVEQPTSFELAINLKAAKAISYEVPAGLALRADEVIE